VSGAALAHSFLGVAVGAVARSYSFCTTRLLTRLAMHSPGGRSVPPIDAVAMMASIACTIVLPVAAGSPCVHHRLVRRTGRYRSTLTCP
jgi:hypothetical protein